MHFIAKRNWSAGLFCLFDIVTVVKGFCCHPEMYSLYINIFFFFFFLIHALQGQTFLYASDSQKPQSEQRALSLAAWCVPQYSVVPPGVTDWSWHENKVPVGGRGGSRRLARAIGLLFFSFFSFWLQSRQHKQRLVANLLLGTKTCLFHELVSMAKWVIFGGHGMRPCPCDTTGLLLRQRGWGPY